MILDIYQVDAFTSEVFKGNPAAVVPLSNWLDDDVMQAVAIENNLSETAFFVPNDDGTFHLRWFTPTQEVDLCGHATLATSWVIFNEMDYDGDTIVYSSLSGELQVERTPEGIALNFPVWDAELADSNDTLVVQALGYKPDQLYKGKKWVAVVSEERLVRDYKPDFYLINQIPSQGFIVTAKSESNKYDVVSRYFGPQVGIDEDPVTGSAHCLLIPIWCEKLASSKILAYQASERGGLLNCELKNDRVYITGQAVLYLKGQIHV